VLEPLRPGRHIVGTGGTQPGALAVGDADDHPGHSKRLRKPDDDRLQRLLGRSAVGVVVVRSCAGEQVQVRRTGHLVGLAAQAEVEGQQEEHTDGSHVGDTDQHGGRGGEPGHSERNR
jgi:hypothetical protein